MTRALPTDAADRNHLAKYLAGKADRTPKETADLLHLRLMADAPQDDASLMIVYEEDGAFRRVFMRGLTGHDLRMIADVLDASLQPT